MLLNIKSDIYHPIHVEDSLSRKKILFIGPLCEKLSARKIILCFG